MSEMRKATRRSQISRSASQTRSKDPRNNGTQEPKSSYKLKALSPVEDQDLNDNVWNDESELLFLQSFLSEMTSYKPIGISKHFCMLVAYNRFCDVLTKPVDVAILWTKLKSLYDIELLEKMIVEDHGLPAPTDFKLDLNDKELAKLMSDRQSKYDMDVTVRPDTPPVSRSTTESPDITKKTNIFKRAGSDTKRSSNSRRKR